MTTSLNRLLVPVALLLAIIGGVYAYLHRSESTATTSPSAQTQVVVDAANTFLTTLTAEQRESVLFTFTPAEAATSTTIARAASTGAASAPGTGMPPGGPASSTGGMRTGGGSGGGGMAGFVAEKYGEAVWSNYPVSDVPRPGLQLGSLTEEQRTAAMNLLKVVLSPDGYQKVLDIMGSDQALADQGQNYAAGEDVYTIGIFGTPSATEPWMIGFGGHHLGLNVVIAGVRGVMTPTLTGAQPSVYTAADGSTVRALAKENDTAFALLDSLTDEQRGAAILTYEVNDLVLGPGHDDEVVPPEGIKASELTNDQKALLIAVIQQWTGIINNAYAEEHFAEIEEDLDDTYFAWSGPTTHVEGQNGSSYYRIQGPKIWIEFSPQGVGGDPTLHVHTIYRDPTNSYGHLYTLGESN